MHSMVISYRFFGGGPIALHGLVMFGALSGHGPSLATGSLRLFSAYLIWQGKVLIDLVSSYINFELISTFNCCFLVNLEEIKRFVRISIDINLKKNGCPAWWLINP